MKFVRFEEMNPLQRRLHNAAIVLECECDEHGFVELLRETIGEIENLRSEADFYRRRCDLLQEWQNRMRDPERTIVCDILANGQTLPDQSGNRYGTPNV